MTALGVARTDLLRTRRTRLAAIVGLLFVGFVGPVSFGVGLSDHTPVEQGYVILSFVGVFVLPLVGIGAAYVSVAGERDTGNVQYLLSLPNSRADVVVGKHLSRLAVCGGAVLVAFGVGTLALVITGAHPDAGAHARFVAATTLYVLAYVGITVGVSAMVATRARALAGSIAAFFLGNVIWLVGPELFHPPNLVAWGFEQVGVHLSDAAVDLLWLLGPTGAYGHALGSALSTNPLDPVSTDAWFLSEPAAVVVLVGWVVLPVLCGYWRFARADLG